MKQKLVRWLKGGSLIKDGMCHERSPGDKDLMPANEAGYLERSELVEIVGDAESIPVIGHIEEELEDELVELEQRRQHPRNTKADDTDKPHKGRRSASGSSGRGTKNSVRGVSGRVRGKR